MATILLISGLVSSGLVAWRYRQIPHFGRFDDDAVYVVCAKALAEGRRPIGDVFLGIPEWAQARGLSYAVLTTSDFSRDLTAGESRAVLESISGRLPRLYSSPDSTVLQFQLR
jgi:hypothetical protein